MYIRGKLGISRATYFRMREQMKLKNWLIPLIVWMFIYIGIRLVFDGGCNDGWSSSSIGRMGACSHHGGVNHTSGFIAFIFATIVSGWLLFKMNEVESRKIRKSYIVESSFFRNGIY